MHDLIATLEGWMGITTQFRVTRLGCRIKFCGNSISCNRHRTFRENLIEAARALCAVLGYNPFKDHVFLMLNGTVERYRELG